MKNRLARVAKVTGGVVLAVTMGLGLIVSGAGSASARKCMTQSVILPGC